MKKNNYLPLVLISIFLGICGFILLWMVDWKVAAGVYICIFSNNLEEKIKELKMLDRRIELLDELTKNTKTK